MANPKSRNEEILWSIINGTPYTKTPLSREEYLLIKLKEAIDAGGGGGLTPEQIEELKRQIIEEAKEVFEAIWFEGTRAEWNALPLNSKKKYDLLLLTDEAKIYKYDKTHNRISVMADGDSANLERILGPVEKPGTSTRAYAEGEAFLIRYSDHSLKLKMAVKAIEIGDALIEDDTDPGYNVTDYDCKTMLEAIEAARDVKSIPIEEIDEMFDNL